MMLDFILIFSCLIPVILKNIMPEQYAAFIFLAVAFFIFRWAFYGQRITPLQRLMPMLLPAGFLLIYSLAAVLGKVSPTFSVVDFSVLAYVCAYCLITLLRFYVDRSEKNS